MCLWDRILGGDCWVKDKRVCYFKNMARFLYEDRNHFGSISSVWKYLFSQSLSSRISCQILIFGPSERQEIVCQYIFNLYFLWLMFVSFHIFKGHLRFLWSICSFHLPVFLSECWSSFLHPFLEVFYILEVYILYNTFSSSWSLVFWLCNTSLPCQTFFGLVTFIDLYCSWIFES